MKLFSTQIVLVITLTAPLFAADPPKPDVAKQELIVVTGTYEPIPLEEADRSVKVFRVPELSLVSNTFADLLKLDSSVDMRQRSPNTVQSDVSIRGGSFGQTLVLIDGLRVNDPQSGHHNFDVPTPLDAVGQIEILKGSGSTLYGSDAIGGVVNFITKRPEASEIRVRGGLGNFGVNQQRVNAAYASARVSQQLSASRDFSTGFIKNRDYRNLSLSSTTHLDSKFGTTRVVLANNDRPFGAEGFYGPYSSWERTRTWFASAHQSFGTNTDASFAFRRHTDLFVLYRDVPQNANRHAAESFQAAVRRREELAPNVRLHYGIEGYRDEVASTNLRNHDRMRGAGYAALDVRAVNRFSFSAGVRDEVFGSAEHELSPSFSFGVWLAPSLKVRSSVSRAFRLPTYTDLYYVDPFNQGTPDLRPERAWSYEAGVDWNAGGRVRTSATVFQRRERDGIDFVRRTASDIWRATNFQRLRFTGVEASVAASLPGRQQLDVSYTGLSGAQTALAGLLSKYVFNYPEHSGIVGWTGTLRSSIAVRTRVGALKRYTRDPYAVWDVYAAGVQGRVRPFLQLTNLSDTTYQEIPGVAMPGRGVVGGLEVVVWGSR